MTREVKLSLILGFAVVLAVGVLLSDHLSGARRAKIEGVNPERGVGPVSTVAPIDEPPSLILVDELGRPQQAQPKPQKSPSVPANWVPPTRLADADPAAQPADAGPALIDRLRDRLANGVSDAVTSLAQGDTPPVAVNFEGVLEPPADRGGVEPVPAEPIPQVVLQPPVESPVVTDSSIPAPVNGQPSGNRLYDVQDGDTLWSIAARELGSGKRHAEILALNRDRLGKDGTLRVGATLRLPGHSAEASPAKPESRSTAVVVDARSAPSKQADAATPTEKNGSRLATKKSGKSKYTVRPGDTLGEIAQKFLGSSSRYEDLLLANADTLSDEHSLQVGMEIMIPSR